MTRAGRIAAESDAVEAVLARLDPVAPDAAARARHALEVVLEPTHRSVWPEVAWRASPLTNTGFPVEFAWSSRDPSIRWTAEAAGPETPEAERLAATLAMLRALGGAAEVPGWMEPRPGAALRFGAWLGGRHGAARNAWKLYVDLAGTVLPASLLPPEVGAAVPRRTQWRMAGLGAGAGDIEIYGRLRQPEAWEVAGLLDRAGIDAAAVLALAAEVTGRPGRDLPRTTGISLALAGSRTAAGGLFFPAGLLLGTDPAASAAVQEVARRHGWDTTIYEAVLGSGSGDERYRHGMIGVGAAADGTTWMQAGLRP
jgi:hypothetical protein